MGIEEILCKWLPKIISLSEFGGDWHKYDNYLYELFREDFIESTPIFNEKPVRIRKHPMQGDKEQAYFHVTSVDSSKTSADPNDRIPDIRRCERILWIRKILENYNCNENCDGFNKIKTWNMPYKMYQRVHFLFEDYRFLVIIEEREDYCLLISAFYIEYDHTLRKKLKEYEKYKAKDA
ncbi:hypothetical protein [Clostridium cochlearium]|uniref:Phage P1-related protein n=1 Tax=Clostridium cochlearium TaxID=1494 RepID=A0A7Y3V6P0_CLOCO|nr:hypothetical protein [Clostridium cochlearium]NOH15466.1 hypothetical protein [Clostridium cochlearium]